MARAGLGQAATDLLSYALFFHASPQAQRVTFASLRGQLLSLLEAFRRSSAALACSPEELEEACFALIAFLDESVISSTWPEREEWKRNLLQMQEYRTVNAGDEFYDHLARLRSEHTEAREIYLLCLALGFEGQYAGMDAERRGLMTRERDLLLRGGHRLDLNTEAHLAPPAYEVDITLPPLRRRRVWPAYLAMAAGVAGIVGGLWWLLDRAAGAVPTPVGF